MTNPIHNSLNITVCEDAQDAIASGFNWSAVAPAMKPIEVKQVIVVRQGTMSGKPTVWTSCWRTRAASASFSW